MGTRELVSRAAELSAGGDLQAALGTSGRVRTFDLQAAYATAVRRRSEPGHADAAALLEAALLARRRDVVGGARWYHRPERVVAIWLALEVLRWTAYAGRSGWTSAVVALALAALVYGGFLLLLRRLYTRAADTAHGSAAAHCRTELTIVSEVTRAVVDRAERADDPAPRGVP